MSPGPSHTSMPDATGLVPSPAARVSSRGSAPAPGWRRRIAPICGLLAVVAIAAFAWSEYHPKALDSAAEEKNKPAAQAAFGKMRGSCKGCHDVHKG